MVYEKRRIKIIILCMAVFLMLSGCGQGSTKGTLGESVADSPAEAEDNVCVKFFGSYEIEEGWIESDIYSSYSQIFYVQEKDEKDERPDNVAIVTGENPYGREDHEKFKQEIMLQLAQQMGDNEDFSLTDSGSTTEQGYILYTFIVEEISTGIKTTQYYIVDDRKYCLIHETNFTGDEAADEMALKMTHTFMWPEE